MGSTASAVSSARADSREQCSAISSSHAGPVTRAAAATVTGPAWLDEVAAHCSRASARAMLTALAVEPMRSVGEGDSIHVNAVMARLQEMATVRRVASLKSKLQRMNPVEAPDEYTKVFGQLVALEAQARSLRERAMGGLTP